MALFKPKANGNIIIRKLLNVSGCGVFWLRVHAVTFENVYLQSAVAKAPGCSSCSAQLGPQKGKVRPRAVSTSWLLFLFTPN